MLLEIFWIIQKDKLNIDLCICSVFLQKLFEYRQKSMKITTFLSANIKMIYVSCLIDPKFSLDS